MTASKALIAAGADTAVTNRGGWTPADLAFMQGHKLVGELIEGAAGTGAEKDRTYSSARWGLVEARYMANFIEDLTPELQKKCLDDIAGAGFCTIGEGDDELDLVKRFGVVLTLIASKSQ